MAGWISSGVIEGIAVETPCNGYSKARRAPQTSHYPHRLRSASYPRGLPTLTGPDKCAVTLSNKLGDTAQALIDIAYKHRVPGFEENPGASYLWDQPTRKRFAELPHVVDRLVDMCAFGAEFRKRTRLRFWYWDDFYFTTCVCCPPPVPLQGEPKGSRDTRICQYTGRKHTILSGIKDKDFATRQSSAYPVQLCKELARSFDAKMLRSNRPIFIGGCPLLKETGAKEERGHPKGLVASETPSGRRATNMWKHLSSGGANAPREEMSHK